MSEREAPDYPAIAARRKEVEARFNAWAAEAPCACLTCWMMRQGGKGLLFKPTTP